MKISSCPLSLLPLWAIVQSSFRLIFYSTTPSLERVGIYTLFNVYECFCSFFLLLHFVPRSPWIFRYMMKIKVHSMKKISSWPLPLLPIWAMTSGVVVQMGFFFGRVVGDFWVYGFKNVYKCLLHVFCLLFCFCGLLFYFNQVCLLVCLFVWICRSQMQCRGPDPET